jgi:hypothetical protein
MCRFCKRNSTLSVGQRSNAHIYNVICKRKSIFSQQDDDDAGMPTFLFS